MESFNFNPEKPVQSILRHFLLATYYAEMEHKMILYDIEHYDDTDILKQELRLNSGYLFEFRSFIRMMRSEYPHTGVCSPHLITKEIAETDHPNLLLHAAFIMSFCAHTSRSSQMKQVIEAELKCIEQCKIQDSITTKTYAYCAMALSNLQVGLEQNALQCIDNALEIVPNMFRALEIRAQIFLVGKKYDAALRDLQVMLEHGPERKVQKSKIHGNLALVYQKKGDMRAAEQHIVKALEYDINNAACHLMLIYDAADVREFQVMERLLNHNVMLMNNTLGFIKIWSNVIDIYKREGNVQKADQYNDKLDKLVKSINRIS
jgi:tetratricopeptide (TPR) repeat protein